MKQTKKDLALSLRAAGRSVEEIAQTLRCSPTYIANVLAADGKTTDYSDLYTNSATQKRLRPRFQRRPAFQEHRSGESVR